MIKKLNITQIHAALRTLIETNTGMKAYDVVPVDAPAPFYFIEVAGRENIDTKALLRERVTVNVHGIAADTAGVYDLINSLDEAMTEEIALPEGYELIRQIDNGLSGILIDETEERHSVCSYSFDICYGTKIKI